MKKLIFGLLTLIGINFSIAQNSPSLIPLASGEEVAKINQTISGSKDFITSYNKAASGADLGAQMQTGVMDRNTPIRYLAYLIKILMQIAMVIGALMIIYAGYIYASGVFSGNVTKAPGAIKSAIAGILVMTFSYLIIKILTSMFIS